MRWAGFGSHGGLVLGCSGAKQYSDNKTPYLFRGPSAMASAPISTPLHSGWLHKRGHFNTNFKRRWFVLSDHLKLAYYEVPGDPGRNKPKGEVRSLAFLPLRIQGLWG
jgi:hypothetical protein